MTGRQVWRAIRPYVLFAFATLLRRTGVFERFRGFQWRGRFKHPLKRWKTYNHSGGRVTSSTRRVGPVSQNSRTRRVSVDLPGPLRWASRRRQS